MADLVYQCGIHPPTLRVCAPARRGNRYNSSDNVNDAAANVQSITSHGFLEWKRFRHGNMVFRNSSQRYHNRVGLGALVIRDNLSLCSVHWSRM